MKKILLIITAVLLVFSTVFLVACKKTGAETDFTITFEVDGKVHDTLSTAGNTTLTLPASPKKDGYTFRGWFVEKTLLSELTAQYFSNKPLTENITVYAKWDTDQYTINYNLNGGTNNEDNPNKYTIEDAVTLSSPDKANNAFLGWFVDETFQTAFSGISKGTTGEVTVYAKWAINHFTYTFFAYDGITVLKTATVPYGSNIVAPSPNPTKADTNGYRYMFYGWDKDIPTTITENITFTAYYEPTIIQYFVTYILNGGITNEGNLYTYTVEDNTFTLLEPTRTGYTFAGWFVDANFDTQISEIARGSIGDLRLYAKWDKILTLDNEIVQTINTIWSNYPIHLVDATDGDFYYICQQYQTTAEVLYKVLVLDGLYVAFEFTPQVNRNEYLTILSNSYDWFDIINAGYIYKYLANSNIVYLDIYSLGYILSGDLEWVESQSAYLSTDSTLLIRYLGEDEEYTIDNKITTIAENAFFGNNTLVTVVIPNSITDIGRQAFAMCQNLVNVTLPDNLTVITEMMFFGCRNLAIINIPSSVTTIQQHAFALCVNLDIALHVGLLYIYEYAFNLCRNMSTIIIPNTVVYIGNGAFSDCNNATFAFIPDSVSYIGEYAFNNAYELILYVQATTKPQSWHEGWTVSEETIHWGVNSLYETEDMLYAIKNEGATLFSYFGSNNTKVTVPSSINANGTIVNVVAIYKRAFVDNQTIKEVIISNGITTIGDEVFAWCYNLEEVSLPNSVLTMGDGVFYDCKKLYSINLPQNLTAIGSNIFANCTDLYSIVIPDTVVEIKYSAFAHCKGLTEITISEASQLELIGEMAFLECNNLTSIYIPNGVTSIGHSAFYRCSSLQSIVLPDSVEFLGVEAFVDCIMLENVVLSANLTAIADFTFFGCVSLSAIIIPSQVESIGANAFRNCSGLQKIYIPISVTYIGQFAFLDCNPYLLTMYIEAEDPTPAIRLPNWDQQYAPNCTRLWSATLVDYNAQELL